MGHHEGAKRTRTYYIAADEVSWNYAPQGRNRITGRPFGERENVFVQRGADRIGSVYRKSVYRQYTDATFKKLVPRGPPWAHLGFLGPTIHAEVGDTIRVVFKNNTHYPANIHPHGVFYEKSAEGARYASSAVATTSWLTESVAVGGRSAVHSPPELTTPESIRW